MIPTNNRLSYANGYLDLGMIEEASHELDAIDDSDRLSPSVLAMRSRLYLEMANWELLEAVSEKLCELDPKQVVGWVHWAYALREMDRNQEAKRVAQIGLRSHPKCAVLWFNLACYCSLLGELEVASSHLDKAIALDEGFESEAVDDPDLANLWDWLRSKGESDE
ncbi:hypothetical protein [Pelagicoccus sp. SDUM812003]|uniref:TPR end-of-group domain-containing protein n=1 Tax=Pelagicoccus sp. SDUM812003 TaxID=3041267 RepID=UPI00280D60B2|nr:hypothetical protein [Pelagicoccus sp. SDUM812003]MDQ8202688.1 hypothetical protein [Pelagicoccus sp. SDUM812003]